MMEWVITVMAVMNLFRYVLTNRESVTEILALIITFSHARSIEKVTW